MGPEDGPGRPGHQMQPRRHPPCAFSATDALRFPRRPFSSQDRQVSLHQALGDGQTCGGLGLPAAQTSFPPAVRRAPGTVWRGWMVPARPSMRPRRVACAAAACCLPGPAGTFDPMHSDPPVPTPRPLEQQRRHTHTTKPPSRRSRACSANPARVGPVRGACHRCLVPCALHGVHCMPCVVPPAEWRDLSSQ